MKTKILSVWLVVCLCLGTLMSCAGAPLNEGTDLDPSTNGRPTAGEPLDGEIGGGGDKNGYGGSKGGAMSDAMEDYDMPAAESESIDAPSGSAPIKPSGGSESYVGDSVVSDAVDDVYIEGGEIVSPGNIQYAAGMLTGSEWRDNDHYADFIAKRELKLI